MTGRAAVGLPKCPAESCFVAIFLAAVQGVLLDHLQKKSAQKMQYRKPYIGIQAVRAIGTPGFEEVPVALHGAFCIEFFELIFLQVVKQTPNIMW